ncbi:hypothetical protein CspeluHIS016_0110720 [Cutaneotrichosporon spelunceum]|uniref:DNA replication regulator Sld3 C-terminal domain-containing protein n=1 Tax=Cutaneotrichosporon spelunceum TaxID=1672016 RepID=A0AAD3Y925_9TREE|nr:hypothetical protein CspeluHIS016_0110720 [Cutaneotrichosporon spelunceum]
MAAPLMSEPAALVFALPPLPFLLDLTCPIPLPARAATNPWTSAVAGPSAAPDETLASYVARRYYEGVYLGEMLAPLAGVVADWQRAAVNDGFADVAQGIIVPLTVTEDRHRRLLAPVVAAVLSSGKTLAEKARVGAAAEAASLGDRERGALETGVGLRANSRAVVDGARGLAQRTLSQGFEMREVMLQLILLLMYRAARPEPMEAKRKRKKASPTEDTDAALVHLTDRISVWLAMSELDIDDGKGKARAGSGPAGAVAALWAVLTTFLPREATFLSAFHLKVFGKEIPPELVPQKKRRRLEVTRRLRRRSSPDSTASGPTSMTMGRSSSRASAASPQRSLFDLPPEPKRAWQLQARPVPKIKRANSMALRKDSKASEPVRDTNGGLMGRSLARSQSSMPALSRSLSRTMSQSQSQSQARSLAKTQSETFVSATPVKANPFRRAVHHPTPIREEPSSAERSVRSFVAETPISNRIDRSPYVGETPRAPALVAETPVARRHGPAFVAETPFTTRISTIAETPGGDSDDDLAGLMIPTDDEESD